MDQEKIEASTETVTIEYHYSLQNYKFVTKWRKKYCQFDAVEIELREWYHIEIELNKFYKKWLDKQWKMSDKEYRENCVEPLAQSTYRHRRAKFLDFATTVALMDSNNLKSNMKKHGNSRKQRDKAEKKKGNDNK